MPWLRRGAVLLALYVAFVGLFIAGSSALGPTLDADAFTPEQAAASLQGMLLVAAVDLALLGTWISRARLAGWRLWLASAAVMYGTMTFSSNLETAWFVQEAVIPPEMLPHLFAMTLPLCLGWTGLATWAWGPREPEPAPIGLPPASVAWRIALAGCVFYPAWFFGFGYQVAWTNPAVRAYYGGPAEPLPILAHLGAMFSSDPLILPFEMFRGLLWLAIGWAVIRGTRGPWWLGWALFAAMMALVQNDLHWLPNPLMPDEVRYVHFWETSISNVLFVASSAALFWPGWGRRRDDAPSAASGVGPSASVSAKGGF